jgi:Domain of unknown function (DUF5666)
MIPFHISSGTTQSDQFSSNEYRLLCATILLCVTTMLSSCGAGDPETKGGTGGTGMSAPPDPIAASGPVTSLGPMGVAGTSLDTTGTNVLLNATGTRPATELRLGMVVDSTGDLVGGTNSGKAQNIVAQSTVRGPVDVVDVERQRVTAVGITADVDQNTILENFTSLNTLRRGARIEVYGLAQETTGRVQATRIIYYPNALATEPVEVLGTATSVSAGSLQIGGASVATTQAQVVLVNGVSLGVPLPANTVVASNTRVRVIGTLNAEGNVIATQIVAGLAPQRAVNSLVALDGTILLSIPTLVRIAEEKIDLSDLPVQTVALVQPGIRAQIRGRKQDTLVRATDARVQQSNEQVVFQIEGVISSFTSAASFDVAGEKISAITARFNGGSTADLTASRRVRIKAVAGAGVLDATEVTFLP